MIEYMADAKPSSLAFQMSEICAGALTSAVPEVKKCRLNDKETDEKSQICPSIICMIAVRRGCFGKDTLRV